MTQKKKTSAAKAKPKPKVSDEQIENASKNVRSAEAKKVPPPPEKVSPDPEEIVPKSETPKEASTGSATDRGGKPLYLKKEVTEFVVGTEDYAAIVADHNTIFGTGWNTHRVRPAVFYGIYKAVQDHFAKQK